MPPILRFIQGKPSDTQIRLIRILWALIIVVLLLFGWNDFSLAYGIPAEGKYALGIFPLISFIRGIFDPGWFHRKTWRWIMVGTGVSMILIGWFVMVQNPQNSVQNTNLSSTGSISASDVLSTPHLRTPINVDFYFSLLGFFLVFAGLVLSGKNITRKNEKYHDVIKTIRV